MNELPWIEVARGYIGEREIPGKQHNPKIINMLTALKAWWKEDETPWCFTGDVEILTRDGFVRFDQLKEQAEASVAMISYGTDPHNYIQYCKDYEYIEKDYDGEIIKDTANGFKCDPRHRIWGNHIKISNSKKRVLSLTPIEEIGKYVTVPTVRSRSWYPGFDKDKLIISAAAAASDVIIYIDKIDVMARSSLAEEYIASLSPDETKRELVSGVRRNVYTFKKSRVEMLLFHAIANGKTEFLTRIPPYQCKMVADAIFEACRIKKDGGAVEYRAWTRNKKVAEAYDLLMFFGGYTLPPHETEPVSKDEPEAEKYGLSLFSSRLENRVVRRRDFVREQYKGKLYCVSVPTSVIVIRTPTGVIMPIGNCGTFVGYCLFKANRNRPQHWYRAKAYGEGYGTRLDKPAYGCLAVLTRKGGGHVAFVVGKDKNGNILLLGGNQGDMVNIAAFPPSRITAYVWPEKEDGSKSTPSPERYNLQIGSAPPSYKES